MDALKSLPVPAVMGAQSSPNMIPRWKVAATFIISTSLVTSCHAFPGNKSTESWNKTVLDMDRSNFDNLYPSLTYIMPLFETFMLPKKGREDWLGYSDGATATS